MDDSDDNDEHKITLEKITDSLEKEIGWALIRLSKEIGDIPDFTGEFLQGNVDLSEFYSVPFRRIPILGYADLVGRAKPLLEQAETINHEKGYRYSGSLLTYNEHIAVGSSVPGKFSLMPDTVIQIANLTLKIEEGEKAMSIEEIRKARILNGMSNIDDTGTVT